MLTESSALNSFGQLLQNRFQIKYVTQKHTYLV